MSGGSPEATSSREREVERDMGPASWMRGPALNRGQGISVLSWKGFAVLKLLVALLFYVLCSHYFFVDLVNWPLAVLCEGVVLLHMHRCSKSVAA